MEDEAQPNTALEPFEGAGSERKEFDAFNASKAGGRGCGRQPSPLVHLHLARERIRDMKKPITPSVVAVRKDRGSAFGR